MVIYSWLFLNGGGKIADLLGSVPCILVFSVEYIHEGSVFFSYVLLSSCLIVYLISYRAKENICDM